MSYVPNLLSINKKGKLTEFWLAATLSEQMLKKKISNKKILQIDITVACKEILKVLNENSWNVQKRFSLYVAATLILGVVRIQLYKVDLVEKSLSVLLYDREPVTSKIGGAAKKKVTCDDPMLLIDLHTDFTTDLTILEPPPFDIENLVVAEDVNLLHELSPRHYREYQEEIRSPTHFGVLTGEEVDVWLNILEGDDTFEQGDSGGRPPSPPPTDDIVLRPAPDASARLDASSIVRRGGQKRSSTGDIRDASAKRPRLLDFVPVAGPEAEGPSVVLQSIHEKSDQPNLPSMEDSDPTIPAPAPAIAPPADSPPPSVQEAADAATNVPIDFSAPQRAKKARRKPRTHRRDKNKTIAEALRRRHFRNTEAHTISSSTIAVVRHKRGVPFSAMRQCPAMTFKFGTNRPPSARQQIFSADLMLSFKTLVSRRIDTTSDYSEHSRIRKSHATIEQMPSGIENKTGPEVSSQDNTAPEAVDSVAAGPVDAAQAGFMNEHGFEANSEAPLPLIEVTDERIPENISQAQVDINAEQPVVTENENGVAVDKFQEFTRDTEDADAFLPQFLRGKDKVPTTSNDETVPAANVEVAGSTFSATQSEEPRCKWTKEHLMECLSAQWRYCSAVPFKKLNPPGEKKKIDVAACLSFLLELNKEKKVWLEQREQIYIEKGSSVNEHEVDD